MGSVRLVIGLKVVAPALGAIFTACALGVVYAHAGCTRINGHAGQLNPGRSVGGASADASDTPKAGDQIKDACTPVVIHVSILGSHRTPLPAFGGDIHGPSVIVRHFVSSDPSLEGRLHTWINVKLAPPRFAAPYSVHELCSTEEASLNYLRLACLRGASARLSTIEYRIDKGGKFAVSVDGVVDPLSEDESYNTPIPTGACAMLESAIPKRDLSRLQKAYNNNEPSERCQTSNLPRRKVIAKLSHVPLPRSHELYDTRNWKKEREPPYRSCTSITLVRLNLPPAVGLPQELGTLAGQCTEVCDVTSDEQLKSVGAACGESGSVSAYQLGDNFYIVENDHVRQVQLPCAVELAIDVTEFKAQIGWR